MRFWTIYGGSVCAVGTFKMCRSHKVLSVYNIAVEYLSVSIVIKEWAVLTKTLV